MPPHLAAIVLPCLLGSRRDVVAWRQSVIHDQAKHPLHLPVLARCPFRSIPSHVVRGEDSSNNSGGDRTRMSQVYPPKRYDGLYGIPVFGRYQDSLTSRCVCQFRHGVVAGLTPA